MNEEKITLCKLQEIDPIKYFGVCQCVECKQERINSQLTTPKIEGFSKYHKIYAMGHEDNKRMFKDKQLIVHVEEKIDASNFRYMIKDNRIIFGTKGRYVGDSNEERFGQWTRCVKHIKKHVKPTKELEGFIFYGEAIFKHSLEYDWEKIPPYLGFDIFNMKTEKYVNYDTKKKMFEDLGLEIVPLIKKCKIQDLGKINDNIIPKSKYADGPAEGVVIKLYDYPSKNGIIFYKIVSNKFKEVNKNAFGIGRKHAADDDELIVAMYCPNARIDKTVFRLMHEGSALDLTMMGELVKAVYKDMMQECWQEITYSRYTINFAKVKKLISKRCMSVLQQIMINSALNEME